MHSSVRWSALVAACGVLAGCGGGVAAPPVAAPVPPAVDAPSPPPPAPPPAPAAASLRTTCSGPGQTGWCWVSPGYAPFDLFDFDFVDGQRGWAVGESGVIVSADAGGRRRTQQLSPVSEELGQVKFADRMHGYAVARMSRKVLATDDGGNTWRVRGEVPLGVAGSYWPRPVDRIWTVGTSTLVASGGDPGSAVSEDGGSTWRASVLRKVTDVSRAGTLWNRSYDGLWVSHDLGSTSERTLACSYPCFILATDLRDESALRVIATSSPYSADAKLVSLTSTDGAKTWESRPVRVPPIPANESMPAFMVSLVEGQRAWGAMTAYPKGNIQSGDVIVPEPVFLVAVARRWPHVATGRTSTCLQDCGPTADRARRHDGLGHRPPAGFHHNGPWRFLEEGPGSG